MRENENPMNTEQSEKPNTVLATTPIHHSSCISQLPGFPGLWLENYDPRGRKQPARPLSHNPLRHRILLKIVLLAILTILPLLR